MSEAAIRTICVTDARRSSRGFRALGTRASEPETDLPSVESVEMPTLDMYQAGYDTGRRDAEVAFNVERTQYKALIATANALQSEPSEELAVLIAEAVERLVTQIVGNAPVDRDWLNHHAARAAALVADCDAARTMWLHPDDLPLIDGDQISLTLMADPNADRGSIRIECSNGWIEHGKALYLEAMRAELGLAGGAA
jgi:flagellar assembly protein FliH